MIYGHPQPSRPYLIMENMTFMDKFDYTYLPTLIISVQCPFLSYFEHIKFETLNKTKT